MNLGKNAMDFSYYVRTEPTADIIKWVKSKKSEPNFNELNYILLNKSIKHVRLDLAKFLLQNNCSINKPIGMEMPPHKNSPLHYAAILGNVSLFEDLLNRQASLLAVNLEGNTALHLAFIFKHEKIVDLLFTALKDISNYVNFKNNEGLTHLHIASTRTDATIVENYLKLNAADVNDAVSEKSMTWAGYTALHFAAKYKSFAAVNVLLTHKAARDGRDSNGQTPLQLATDNLVEPSMIAELLSEDTSMSHIHTACLKKDSLLVKSYIEKGVDVNFTISPTADFCPSYTPLHFAVESGCVDTVKLLLDHGADVNRANKDKMTPLHFALYNDNVRRIKQEFSTSIVDLLFAKVGDKVREDRVDCNGLSYFQVACTRGNCIDDVKKFLDDGVSVNERVSYGDHHYARFTPLHFAALYGQRKIVELLIERGADVGAVDCDAKRGTPLHVALEDYMNDVSDLLIDEGAKVTAIRADDEKTTLHLIVDSLMCAYRCPHGIWKSCHEAHLRRIERVVTEFGVDVNAKDVDGNTVLHYVCSNLKYTWCSLLRLLLDCGADVNVENRRNRTPLEECSMLEESRGYVDDYATLYYHFCDLKALGLKVNAKNERFFERLIKRREEYFGWDADEFDDRKLELMEKRRSDEIESMKKRKLDKKVSVYDFVTGDEKSGVAYLGHAVLKKFKDRAQAEEEYPLYGYLIRLKYLKASRYLEVSSGSTLKRSASSEIKDEISMPARIVEENVAQRPLKQERVTPEKTSGPTLRRSASSETMETTDSVPEIDIVKENVAQRPVKQERVTPEKTWPSY